MKFYTFATAIAATIVVLAATETSACNRDEWTWDDCSELYWRHPCSDGSDKHLDGYTDCGWVFFDDKFDKQFWVTCSELKTWTTTVRIDGYMTPFINQPIAHGHLEETRSFASQPCESSMPEFDVDQSV